MLNHSGFNDWAPTYDADVAWAEQNNLYPFAGYTRLLQMVTARTLAHPGNSVLDLGCGTAQLTWRLYEMGKHITAIDFSAEMLRQAKEKMPQSCLIQHDFVLGLPPTLAKENFDTILSTYAFHHVPDAQKPALLRELISRLQPNGQILIGDVAFVTRESLLACRERCASDWDDEEHYLVFEELQPHFASYQTSFEPLSFCAGIFTLR